ncbi:hypothetical protein P3X46_021987 [Hevea brasiliensis]|uniref:RNase H type-1 domain-containing protein n=1 Tax=Hevea brasiliensis TaxID=3981 RepID=A0ABQ9LH89_HEVBR|nr:hypothetical protein P3X46_021987 [Hevea brasiliensis]
MCGQVKDLTHALVHYPIVSTGWVYHNIDFDLTIFNFRDYFSIVLGSHDDLKIRKVCMVAWFLWHCRNQATWQGNTMLPNVIVAEALAELHDWELAKTSKVSPSLSSDVNVLKCNIDASLFSPKNASDYGVILRNELGAFVAAISGYINVALQPRIAEAYNLREALSWLIQNDISMVEVEMDCQDFTLL